MLHIFKNEKKISIIFFIILTIDILVKLNLDPFPYRYISKPPIILLLFLYYHYNNNEKRKIKKLWVTLALCSFLLADIFIIKHTNIILLSVSLLLFALAKVFLSLRLSHKSDFNIIRLIPFSIVIGAYTIFIVSLLFDSLKSFFVPALLSFFISLLLIQFAFLRKDVVDKTSYLYVFFGIILYMICESMMAIKTFKMDLPMQDILIMLFYGIAIYLIVFGIVKEHKHDINSF
ncbi:lysoplasmalogenase family protein [Flavivirga amylovorans]|uniref:Lysoplasmalogenase family protein n=1 Tax=Flavivirga amylovorans TaxID=870486 RepID=A0ABT8X6Z4_9FLAO|nr:lysoplasmalogenase family protein [Flavivirga amylovorans]MDO5989660.1 lysoplasmalogenase family protein [Flavivirga amylovorans]